MRLPEPIVRRALRVASRWVADPRRPFPVQRRRWERVATLTPPPRGTSFEAVTVAGVRCERVAAAGADGDRLVVHLHGGGFCLGSPRIHRGFAARLSAAAGATVLLPDYRLAPEHPHPAAADDALAVWASVGRPDAVLSGDSAGGALALLTAVRARDGAAPAPAGLVLLSPHVDAAVDPIADAALAARDVVLGGDWLTRCALSYAAGRPLDDPAISPVNQDLSGLPPTLVVAGTDEILLPSCDRLVERARAAGVTVDYLRREGGWHIYPTQAGLSAAADAAVTAIAAFVAARTARAGAGTAAG